MKILSVCWLHLLASPARLASFGQAAEPGVAVRGKALVEKLRKGGLVVYFRHTKTLPEYEYEGRLRREPRRYARSLGNLRCFFCRGRAQFQRQIPIQTKALKPPADWQASFDLRFHAARSPAILCASRTRPQFFQTQRAADQMGSRAYSL
jgi:hypothetical protein